MELDLYCLPDNELHAFGSHGQDLGVCYAKLMVLLDLRQNGTPSSINVDITIFTGYAVGTSCFQAIVIPDRPKETGNLPRQEVYSLDVMSC